MSSKVAPFPPSSCRRAWVLREIEIVVTSSILVIASTMHIADTREVPTVPMARQRKMLPRPCPVEGCGRKYGTFQFILFNSKYKYSRYNLTCRIRHYDPQKYAKIANRRKKRRAFVAMSIISCVIMLMYAFFVLRKKTLGWRKCSRTILSRLT
jgi:hypothetical protein